MKDRLFSMRLLPYYHRIFMEVRKFISLTQLKGGKCSASKATSHLLEFWLAHQPIEIREELKKFAAMDVYDYDEENRLYEEDRLKTMMEKR